MSFEDRAAASAVRLVGRFQGANELRIIKQGAVSYGADLSVTAFPDCLDVPCTVPVPFFGAGDADRFQRGLSTVFVEREHPALSFEPQVGMIAELAGEQYRVERVDYLPGSIRLDLAGAAAGGAESA
jgi:hypothetical protein